MIQDRRERPITFKRLSSPKANNHSLLVDKAIHELRSACEVADNEEQLSTLYIQIMKHCFLFIEFSAEEFCRRAGLAPKFERDFANVMMILPPLLAAGLQYNFL